ncbi:MAG: hypothetical protein LAO30_19430 [Acidobacteriia bacterium]|nr:hypothetical protein [Terriglobia bacterium]
MRVLLVHPEDSPTAGVWSGSHWDLVVDMGWAGTAQYADWSEKLGCPTLGLYSYAAWHDDIRRIHEIFQAGSDCLVDAEGIDWWELLAPVGFQGIYEFLLLLKIAGTIQSPAEVRVTRPHRLAETLGELLRVNVTPFIRQAPPVSAWVGRYTKALRTLTSGQVAGIALDKWDTDYRLRRLLHRPKRSSNLEQRTLLPSSYRNVSRVLASYADVLPDRRFLLVTTRSDGAIHDLPPNVDSVPLAAYAPLPRNKNTGREITALTEQWREMQRRLQQSKDPVVSYAGGLFPDFARTLRVGMRIRDAWREVLDQERISSVLCGDENNPYTRLPVLLAKNRGVRTVHCSHGALDVNLLLRGICSDSYLAKGEMEKDYMTQECGVPEERIVPGAPPVEHFFSRGESRPPGDQIVFFSEPYELYAGRTETLYRELLPSLCAIARQYGRKVVLKLHPYESAKARSRLVDQILTSEDRQLMDVSTAPISEQLLRRIWFGLTLESSVAVECALAGIPFFLCGWFDLGLHRYGRQYEKFGAARVLKSPSAVLRIPEMLDSRCPSADSRNLFYQPITQVELEGILQSSPGAPAKNTRSKV